MVELRGVTIEGLVRDADITVPEGSVCKVITETDMGKDALLGTLAGLRRPEQGEVRLLGVDVYGGPEGEAVSLYRNVGVVWRDGGLVSNLRVWENISLPLEYHAGTRPAELEGRVRSMLEFLGPAAGALASQMDLIPAHLREQERTAAGLVRAMLMEPLLLIYDSIIEGLSAGAARKLAACLTAYQRERPGRTSVFVSSDEQSLEGIEAGMVLRQNGDVLEQAGADGVNG